MKAMILAAGRGSRMRPLTDHTPKPLLKVGSQSLLERHLIRLSEAGFREIVVNVSHLAEQIIKFCEIKSNLGAKILVSPEKEPLETAGGIKNALPLLGDLPFLVVNGDIWTDFEFKQLIANSLSEKSLAHLVLVGNPPEHLSGDYALNCGTVSQALNGASFTYAGIGIFNPVLFSRFNKAKGPLRPLLDQAIDRGHVTGQLYGGLWYDIGTPDRLEKLNKSLKRS